MDAVHVAINKADQLIEQKVVKYAHDVLAPVSCRLSAPSESVDYVYRR